VMKSQTPRLRLGGGIVSIGLCVAAFALVARSKPEPYPQNESLSNNSSPTPNHCADPAQSAARQLIEFGVARAIVDNMEPRHQDMLAHLIQAQAAARDPIAVCFAPGTPEEVVRLFNTVPLGFDNAAPRYQATSRWSATATGAASFTQGSPVTLTYSFVPDGVNIPGGAGEAASPSALFAFLDGIYGSTATWQALYAQVFARWGQLANITYVFEPNDDGATFSSSPGVLGVRGDMRMAGHPIDGNSGVLAFNYFPNTGDMVIDTSDNFFATTTSNSLRLRNVLAHEHGHGLGMLHVCPVQQTKLMEPFVSVAYDGPRHDEVRLGQRFYGDPSEPNDTRATATVVGTLNVGPPTILGNVSGASIPSGSLLSIDGDGDQDYFRISVTAPRGLTVIVTPQGLSYDSSAQSSSCTGSGSCCSGNFINSAAMANLAIQVQDASGAVITTVDSQPSGTTETAPGVFLPAAGDYYVRVFESDSPTESQLYLLSLQVGAVPVTVSLPNGAPTALTPGITSNFAVTVNPGEDTVVAGSPTLRYRYDNGTYLSAPLIPQGGNNYLAVLPPPACDSVPQFYVSAQGVTSGTVTNPVGAPAAFYSAIVGTPITLASLNFQSDGGFTVVNETGLTDGPWTRGVPIVDANCQNRGAPAADADGSGACWVTDNDAANSCNSDVDGGITRLVSPVFDVSTLNEATVSYARWFANNRGQNPMTQPFVIEVSSDGGTNWLPLETVGPTSSDLNPEINGGWFNKSFLISSFVTPTNQFRIRFSAQDIGAGSVVEAGIDAFAITGRSCTPVTCTACDVNGDTTVNGLDIAAFTAALLSGTPTPGQVCAGDIHTPKDGLVNAGDVADFVNCVLAAN